MKYVFLFLVSLASCFGSTFESTLSLEEKIGQLLMVHFHGEDANEEAKILVQNIKVGGILYFPWSNGLCCPQQIKTLSSHLQQLAQENANSIPLFIAVDQEGGPVTRLRQGFTEFPGNKALAMTQDPNIAELAALKMGEEMRAVGININFAPVVDVNSNPKNPVIGDRSFSENPEIVLNFGEKVMQGFKKAHIISTLKHFPGHGDVDVDSHKDLPVVNKTLEELQKVELLPFAGLAPFAEVIMTAHILVPALDEENCATLSKKILTYLKNILGFHGVIISDSLVMEGVLKTCHTVEEAAIQALNAGCDILLLGGKASLELTLHDIQRIQCSLIEAVKEERILEERIDEALEKILKLKETYINPKKLS